MSARPASFTAALLLLINTHAPADERPLPTTTIEQAEVHLVLVDAVVTGKGDRPVQGLTKDRFTLRIDGNRADISTFEDHCPAPAPAPAEQVVPTTPSIAVPGGGAGAPEAGASPDPRRVVLYFDLPHLSPPGAARSVRAARRYLEAAGAEGARYMVVAYGPDVRILSPFTSDKDRILAALDRVTENGVTYDEGPMARATNIYQLLEIRCLVAALDPMTGECQPQSARAREMAREEESIARKSLDALRATLVSMGGVPGRKALVFFTETLRDEPGSYYLSIAGTNPGREQISIATDFRAAVAEANAASVSFYPVFAPGLDDASDTQIAFPMRGTGAGVIRPPTAAVSSPPSAPGNWGMTGSPPAKRMHPPTVGEAQIQADAAALGFNVSIAAETGGRHLGRTNDLSLIFPIVRDETSCYYVLSYAPPLREDGKRHSIDLRVEGKGLAVRSRQYYVDYGPGERAERRMQTALAVPGAFRDLGVTIDAFALGRSKAGRQVIVEASVPAADIARSAAGLGPGDDAAGVKIEGRVTGAARELCAFGAEFEMVEIASAASKHASLHYEAACSLPPGPCEISAAVAERKGGSLGAARKEIHVAAIAGFQVSDPQLWASSPADLVYREEAPEIFGPAKGMTMGAATPRAERRMMPGEKGSLLFLICPPAGSQAAQVSADRPVVVTRVILSGETPVATFPPLKLTEKPDEGSGCWGVSSEISSKVFGQGVYTFNYEVSAPGMSEPIARSAAFAVGDAGPWGISAPETGEGPPSP
jgi:VWFA-related protein